LRGGVEQERVLGPESRGACCCGVGSEVGLGEGYRDGGVGWKVQFCIAFSPVSRVVRGEERGKRGCLLDNSDVDWGRRAGLVDLIVRHFKGNPTSMGCEKGL
jgi:hypothetical protein